MSKSDKGGGENQGKVKRRGSQYNFIQQAKNSISDNAAWISETNLFDAHHADPQSCSGGYTHQQMVVSHCNFSFIIRHVSMEKEGFILTVLFHLSRIYLKAKMYS